MDDIFQIVNFVASDYDLPNGWWESIPRSLLVEGDHEGGDVSEQVILGDRPGRPARRLAVDYFGVRLREGVS